MLPAALCAASLWMPRCGAPPPHQKARRARDPSPVIAIECGLSCRAKQLQRKAGSW